ncbi:Alpha/Beta hydrolase protein [Aspergillus undulatus]|uniref:Alpha/Beta hydrolase protein n=1 Tax=Aspergillus undulatus TaxID=1810928 RepID=UPI003CCCF6F4
MITGSNENEGASFGTFNASGESPENYQAGLNTITCPVACEVRNRLNNNFTTYRYLYSGNFSNISPLPWVGAAHSAELPLIFNTHWLYRDDSTPYEYKVGFAMQDLWLSFARNSSANPTNRYGFTWTKGRLEGETMAVFAANGTINQAGSGAELSVADALLRDYFGFGLTTSRFVHEPTLRGLYWRLYSSDNNDGLGQEMIRYLLNHSKKHDAWSSFGIIVRQAQALGLHRLSTRSPANHVDREYHKRVFWSIYTYDRILSRIFGRPCALHDDDIGQEECVLANDEDLSPSECRIRDPNNSSFCTAAGLIHYARLSQILGVLLSEFYSPRRKRHTLHSMQATALHLQDRLISWQASLSAGVEGDLTGQRYLEIPK